jgi:hypothetical protein
MTFSLSVDDLNQYDHDDGQDETADSDEAAQAFRFDGARYSDMMSPRAWSLAGW